jgi:hypothetical protein
MCQFDRVSRAFLRHEAHGGPCPAPKKKEFAGSIDQVMRAGKSAWWFAHAKWCRNLLFIEFVLPHQKSRSSRASIFALICLFQWWLPTSQF